nr:fatty acid transporter protein-like [Quercus suber]
MAAAIHALAGIPRKIAIPAAAASLAYLNAKFGIVHDSFNIFSAIKFQKQLAQLDKDDRVSVFYVFEKLATETASANRTFLVVPSDAVEPGRQSEWTYAEAYETVLKYARWLKEVHHVQKNEIVAMDFTNGPEFIWLWFALWSLGAKPAFINTNLRSNAFVHCVKISTSRLLLVDRAIREVLTDETRAALGTPDENGQTVQVQILEADIASTIGTGEPYRAPDAERSGDLVSSPSILIYTSGTTGLPKAAKVNWGKPLSGCLFFCKLLALKSTDRYFTAMPLYHSSASVLGVCQALGAGCTVVVAPKFSPRTVMAQVAETKATVFQYIGEMCRYLLASPSTPYDRNHNLRLAFGNGMRPDVWQRFKDRFGIADIVEFYGATEGPGASFVYERNGFYRGAIGRSGALSKLMFGSQQVIVRHDHNTDEPLRDVKTNLCARADPNEPGELIYALDPAAISDKFQGYFGNSKASDSKIIRDVFVKGDAYYRTGDLQKRDEDGRVWFIDRIGDTYRWKSENVSTLEVSESLGSHPAISEANVYGVELPNHDGRAGCAAIGLTEGKQLDAQLRRDLATQVRKRLPRYAVPLFLRVSKALEVTGTMKHQKVALRNQGVDPSLTVGDDMYWLPPDADAYEPFGSKEWERLVGGSAKL